MEVKRFVQKIKEMGIETVTGIPDSTLKRFCDYIGNEGKEIFCSHIVPENEGAAVGIAIGDYLATGKPACVYMQNSGLGNIVNPITSLAHSDVYGIPMLLLVGWRGEANVKDEPQHKFMGKITLELLRLLEIAYAVVDDKTTTSELDDIFSMAKKCLAYNKQYAIVIRKGTFGNDALFEYTNRNCLMREMAIREIVKWCGPEDLFVATTGKISRELYELLDEIKGNHSQAFLTVGGMGHAKMIAYGIAQREKRHRIICLDGDGALLMHMGGMAVIGKHPKDNLVHVCIDNEAHESVGGMATGAAGLNYEKLAEECGYPSVYLAETEQDLKKILREIGERREMAFVRIKVALGARDNLGRPKESPQENKKAFMKMMG